MGVSLRLLGFSPWSLPLADFAVRKTGRRCARGTPRPPPLPQRSRQHAACDDEIERHEQIGRVAAGMQRDAKGQRRHDRQRKQDRPATKGGGEDRDCRQPCEDERRRAESSCRADRRSGPSATGRRGSGPGRGRAPAASLPSAAGRAAARSTRRLTPAAIRTPARGEEVAQPLRAPSQQLLRRPARASDAGASRRRGPACGPGRAV